MVFLILASALLGQTRLLAQTSKSGIEQLMIENEKAVWAAAKAHDVARFEHVVAEDARMIFESGVFTRAGYLSGLADRTITDFALSDFVVVHPNPQTAIVIYKASRSGTYKGQPFPPATVREASVWVKRAGRWVAVLNQETPVAP